MTSRVAPGGATTICLGSDSAAAIFQERSQKRGADVDTPEPTSRFPHAPGGDSSICLGGAEADVAAVRGEVGGATSVCLGGEDLQVILQERHQQRSQPVETPDAAVRFPQAPGGTASVCLGGSGERPSADTGRGPVGGATSISLGNASSAETFAERRQDLHADIVTPDAAPRFPQAPGGTSSVCLGPGSPEVEELTIASRGPVGGHTTVDLSHTEGETENLAAPPTRGPVGGETTILLGGVVAKEVFDERQQRLEASFETPDATARFPQAPGGTSSLHLGPASSTEALNSSPREPVGGATTICLGCDSASEGVDVQPRGPVGGVASVVLGQDNLTDILQQHDRIRSTPVETPDAAPRFPQAPGGTASVHLGPAEQSEMCAQQTRGPVGGATTLVLGDTDPSEIFNQLSSDGKVVDTPEPALRFTQAPGGTASIDLGNVGAALDPIPEVTRGPVGGESTLVLNDGSGFTAAKIMDIVETPAAAPRFPQAPGGSSTLILGASASCEEILSSEVVPRRPVGGESTVVLGQDVNLLGADRGNNGFVDTPDAAPRFPQAPGGTASIILGGDSTGDPAVSARGPVGGAASVIFGSDDRWEEAAIGRSVGVETPDPAPRFSQAPGGSATVILGGGVISPAAKQSRIAPGGECTLVLGGEYPHDIVQNDESSNWFACGNNQNSGNVLSERPSTRLHHAPGGRSTICLGDSATVEAMRDSTQSVSAAMKAQEKMLAEQDGHTQRSQICATTLVLGGEYPNDIVDAKKISSNAFANGANQNAGNTITERPTTRLHQAPGGNSTICLGNWSSSDGVGCNESSSKFASGASQNAGNTITDRSTTKVHQAPGGKSSICLGSEADRCADVSNLDGATDQTKDAQTKILAGLTDDRIPADLPAAGGA